MHEIRATLPLDHVADGARTGPGFRNRARRHRLRLVASVETSMPKARLFVEALLSSLVLFAGDRPLILCELTAIVAHGSRGSGASPSQLLGFLFRDLGARAARLTKSNSNGLLAALHLIATAGLQLALLVPHDLVDLAFAFGAALRA